MSNLNLGGKLRLTIGTKLVGLIALLLMASVATLIVLSSRMFIEDNTALIQQMNSDTAGGLATQMRELFTNLSEKMRVMGTVLNANATASGAPAGTPAPTDVNPNQSVLDEFFAKDKDFMAVYVVHHADDGSVNITAKSFSPDLKAMNETAGDTLIEGLKTNNDFSLAQASTGDVQFTPVKLPDDTAAIAIAVPFIQNPSQEGKYIYTLTAILKQAKFVKAFTDSDLVTSFMVDRKGRLLAHPDANRVANGENFSNLGIVKQLLEGKFNNGQTRYLDPVSNEAKLGAFKMVGFGNLGVVAEVYEAKAFEAANRVVYRSILVGIIVLSLAFFAGYFFSGTITWPIKKLVEAARMIAAGNFAIDLKPKGKDEVAMLSLAFNDMAKGLEERDKVKETFNKFHNKEIAEKLLSGEVKLGGERREATIFFSDVRGFTGMSESMEPEQVVEMLNEYMTRMVSVITKHGGIVDKYVGDAIMALWGVPLAKGDDTANAIRACVEMRKELASLNELRISRGQTPLKIGMGVNVGQVIAGNIGSNEKMEYTVIGDSVNLASRIESMTKEYGTDLLISESIHDRIKDKFILEACKSMKVKGKSTAINVFKVKGYFTEEGAPYIVETPYSSYEAEKSDKVVHDKKDAHAEAEAEAPVAAAPVAVVPVAVTPAPVAPVTVAAPVAPVTVAAPAAAVTVPTFVEPAPSVVLPAVAFDDAGKDYGFPEHTGIFGDLQNTTTITRPEPAAPVAPVATVIAPAPVPAPAPVAVVAAPAPVMDDKAAILASMMNSALVTVDDFNAAVESGTSTTAAFTPTPAAPAPVLQINTSKDEWYFRIAEEVFGTFTKKEIHEGLMARELTLNMSVSPSTNGPWIPLMKHPAFTDIVKQVVATAKKAS